MAWIPAASAQNAADSGFHGALVGQQFDYTVQPGDYLGRIGARFGVETSVLARTNALKLNAILQPGQLLQIDNRHIVPEQLEQGILINLPQRMLYYFQSGDLVAHYPVALGRPDWATPAGNFTVANLQENKTWYVPKSIQEEMQREGKTVLTAVPPGPENPLGKHWIGLSLPGIGIHGTIAPSSIYRFQSHGCIRLHPDDIAALFPQVSTGQPGKIMYAPVLLAQLDDGRIFLEVNRDIYKKGINSFTQVEHAARIQGISHLMDWYKVNKIIQLKEGLAREVGLASLPVLTGGNP